MHFQQLGTDQPIQAKWVGHVLPQVFWNTLAIVVLTAIALSFLNLSHAIHTFLQLQRVISDPAGWFLCLLSISVWPSSFICVLEDIEQSVSVVTRRCRILRIGGG